MKQAGDLKEISRLEAFVRNHLQLNSKDYSVKQKENDKSDKGNTITRTRAIKL